MMVLLMMMMIIIWRNNTKGWWTDYCLQKWPIDQFTSSKYFIVHNFLHSLQFSIFNFISFWFNHKKLYVHIIQTHGWRSCILLSCAPKLNTFVYDGRLQYQFNYETIKWWTQLRNPSIHSIVLENLFRAKRELKTKRKWFRPFSERELCIVYVECECECLTPFCSPPFKSKFNSI